MGEKKKDKRKFEQEIEFDGSVNREQLSRYLHDLADCVVDGEFGVESSGESMRLLLDDAVAMKLRAQMNDEEQTLKLSFAWKLRRSVKPKSEAFRFVRSGATNGQGTEHAAPSDAERSDNSKSGRTVRL